ncbi:MAG TPA: ATP-dependent helicase [Beutenbergiaceae bacterium]|nr:ATP-dependent helicase [Beutenbergiaceae bacterium]
MRTTEPAGREPEPSPGSGLPGSFSTATTSWFTSAFAAPTPAQEQAWAAITSGDHALVVAPTGSGKTLAAFLSALDDLLTAPAPAERAERCQVLYISPLKALAADVQRNLRSPLVGITRAAQGLGEPVRDVQVGMRTGDTPAVERRAFATRPPDILITTPESLFLILTSAAREGLRGVRQVIVDEVHALAGNKRGGHLALSLERLDALLPRPAQRIGLSATVRPVQEVARFLVGAPEAAGARGVQVVRPPSAKELQIDIAVPVPDLSDIAGAAPAAEVDLSGPAAGALPRTTPAGGSIWPHVTERVVDLITAHRATIVFTNSRRSAERLTARINEVHAQREGLAAPDPGAQAPAEVAGQSGAADAVPPEAVIARAHHGSMSRAERTSIESDLKAGHLPAVVATSSLELGIDMGAVDLVIQVGAPPSVASTLQRIGRAGHQVGVPSRGVVLPTHRGDLLAAAGTAVRARSGQIEAVTVPANPLDVLAQQVVAATAMDPWDAGELLALARRAAPFSQLGQGAWQAVLDMLSGRYPSEDFAELRPRVVWDRVSGTLTARPGALRLAATSGGTIPDRGLFGVYVAGTETSRRGGKRVGELDEEMVFESRAGDTFTLGSSTWRIEEITADRVLVSPAPGLPGRLPFWKGDAPGRPAELGRAMGAMLRQVAESGFDPGALADWGLDEWAGQNLLAYLRDQDEATGQLSTDTTLVVERFRDELGDWRVAIHSPYGAEVHGPWALVISARLRERYGMDAQVMHTDDGIVLRLPDQDTWEVLDQGGLDGRPAEVDLSAILVEPDRVRTEVVQALSGSAHFAARFREAAARSLLLPRRRPDRRQPLWQQRQRSAQLLSVAAQFDDFPVVLEAVRECLQDDFDVPALVELMQEVSRRQVQVVEVHTTKPSPFAQSLLFGYVAQFLYDGDAPLAERRAAALTLDARLLGELLGEGAEVAELLDPQAIASVEAEVGLTRDVDRAHDAEAVADLVRRLGPIGADELRARSARPDEVAHWLTELAAARRVVPIRLAGTEQWIVGEDAGRMRDGLGVALPAGLPEDFTAEVPTALEDLLRRHARTHGPFRAAQAAERFGLGPAAVAPALADLVSRGLLTAGHLRPAQAHDALSAAMAPPDYCDADVLRRIRRRSLAALRAEVEPVPPAALGVFSPRWHQFGRLRGTDGVLSVVDQLAGTPIAASAWESLVLPARVSDYRPEMLDELTASGEVVWAGAGSGPGSDGLVALLPADSIADLAPEPTGEAGAGTRATVLETLGSSGGLFFRDLLARLQAGGDPDLQASEVLDTLWQLVWHGWVTNDSLAPLRARLSTSPRPGTRPARRRPRGRSLRMTTLRHDRQTPVSTPPTAVGRWSLLADRSNITRRATAATLAVLDRDGLLTRGSVDSRLAGGFSTAYRVLAQAEESGQVRRGYFIEGLGAAQFALPECVDLLRREARGRDSAPAQLLAATDPANPYGLALGWPDPAGTTTSGHRPGRKVGASVVLVGGQLVLYLERGAKSLLSFSTEDTLLALACAELAAVGASGALGRFTVARADGASALAEKTPVVAALIEAGFIATPRGLRLRHDAPSGG